MGNAFIKDETLIFDHLHRRSQKSRGLQEYPEAVIQSHEAFTQQILDASQAKVIVLYGKKVQERIMGNPKRNITVLPLWDKFEDHFIALDHEENYTNNDTSFTLRRILLFAAHPQRLFYEPLRSKTATEQDMVTIMATRMAGSELRCIDGYYANKYWRRNLLESFLTNITNSTFSFDPAEVTESEIEETKANVFGELSHSNEILRSLTADILSRWSKYDTEQE